jgi:hypothetical protein
MGRRILAADKDVVMHDASSANRFTRRRLYGEYLHHRKKADRQSVYRADVAMTVAAMLQIVEERLGAQAAVTIGTAMYDAYRNETLPLLNADLSEGPS